MKGKGDGLIINLAVGVIGAYIGSFLFGLLGFSMHGLIGSFLTAVTGGGTPAFGRTSEESLTRSTWSGFNFSLCNLYLTLANKVRSKVGYLLGFF